jgi:hypothetical protein
MDVIDKKSSLAILILIGLIFSLAFYSGPSPHFDDSKYLLYSHQILNGTFTILQSSYAYGTGFLYLTAASIYLTGNPILPELLAYLVMSILIYYTLTRFFDPEISFIGALSVELSAFVFLYATRLLPDMFLGCMLAAILWIFAWKRESQPWLCLAGVIIGSSLFIKMGATPLFLGMIPAFFFIYRKDTALLIYPAIVTIGLYVLLLPHGASFLTMITTYGSLQAHLSTATIWTNLSLLYFWTSGYLPRPTFPQIFPLGALFIFAIIGTSLARNLKNKDFYYHTVFVWRNLLYMILGTEALTGWIFITVVDRYLIYFSPGLALLACVFYSELKKIDPQLPWLALLVLIASNVPMYLYFI